MIAVAGRHFPVLLPPSTLHTRQKVLKTEQIWTSIRGWTKSKILVRKTTRGDDGSPHCFYAPVQKRANYLQGKKFEFSIQKLSNLLSFAL